MLYYLFNFFPELELQEFIESDSEAPFHMCLQLEHIKLLVSL